MLKTRQELVIIVEVPKTLFCSSKSPRAGKLVFFSKFIDNLGTLPAKYLPSVA
jgi:hypothetical protein